MSVVEIEIQETAGPSVVTPVTTRDVLHRAADLLEEFGWVQYDCGGKDRGFCLLGAVLEANRDFGRNVYADLESLGDLVWSGLPRRTWGSFPIDWNNASGRTKEEVVTRLREAADAA